MHDLIIPKIGNDGPLGQFSHGQANDQAKREDPIYQPLTKLRFGGKILVDVQRLGIHRQRGEEHVIHFSDGATAVFEFHPYFKFVKIFSGPFKTPLNICFSWVNAIKAQEFKFCELPLIEFLDRF